MKKLSSVIILALLLCICCGSAFAALPGDTASRQRESYGLAPSGNIAQRVFIDGDLSMNNALTVSEIWLTDGTQITGSVFTTSGTTISQNATTSGYTLALDGDLIAEKDLTVYGAAYFEGIGEGTIQIADDLTVYHNLTVSQVPELFLDGVQKTGIFYSGSNVGIGTSSPLATLEVEGGIIVDDYIQAQDASGVLIKTDEGTTRLAVDDGGNVGIGTAAPGSKLDVQGDATVATDMTVGNNLSVGNAISAGTVSADEINTGDGTTDGALNANLDIILNPYLGTGAGTVQLNGDLTVSSDVTANAYFGDGSNLTGISASPGGSDTQIQFNDGGSFGGDAGLVYNKTTDLVSMLGSLTVGKNLTASDAIYAPQFIATGSGDVTISSADTTQVVVDDNLQINGTMTTSGNNTINFADATSAAQFQVNGTGVIDLTDSGNTQVDFAGDVIIANELTLSAPTTVSGAGYYLTWDATTGQVGISAVAL